VLDDVNVVAACKLSSPASLHANLCPPCSAPIVASQLLLVDEVLRAGMNMQVFGGGLGSSCC